MSWIWRQRTGLELVQVMTKEMLRSVNKLFWCESESGSGEVEVYSKQLKKRHHTDRMSTGCLGYFYFILVIRHYYHIKGNM